MQSALVNVHLDGSIQITHSGVEMGQGIHTKTAQMAAWALGHILKDRGNDDGEAASTRPGQMHYYPDAVSSIIVGDLLRHVVVSDTSSEKIPNMSMTGGSTTSEACCGAVQLACKVIVERLQPIKDKLLEQRKEASGASPTAFIMVRYHLCSIGKQDQLSAQRAGVVASNLIYSRARMKHSNTITVRLEGL